MKNTKEIQFILTAIYCINRTGSGDKDIEQICDYAFARIFESNTNLLLLTCAGQTKETFMPVVTELLKQETKYTEYLESIKKGN